MKYFISVLALLIAGLVFVAPPLIAIAPVLFVGLLLMASPALLRGQDRGGSHDDSRVRGGQRPT
jgi:hypothetical protein